MDLPEPSGLHVNYHYVLDFTERQCAAKTGCTILDYGCGRGETVRVGRERGLNIFGAEVFQSDQTRAAAQDSGQLGSFIREIKHGRLDFPDAYFDFVFTNQVLEHVQDLEQVLGEIWRVLKPGCASLHLFPSRDVWREGHCGIPLLHRFPRDSHLRYPYALTLRKLGLGKFKHVDPEGWTRKVLDFLDNYCTYRSRRTIFSTFKRYFTIALIEDDYLRARLSETRFHALAPMVQWPILKPISREAFRKLGGLVILATKQEKPAENL
ncbi:MAG: class I SAM-dependent methyltransferase [Anaerolineales bacterium]|nr:class I SAM-dependent methyltransferase [Anaerolineales bacterium]